MNRRLEYAGIKSNVYSVVLDNGRLPAVEFLEELKSRNLPSHKAMVARYQRHADVGPSLNPKHSRPIKGRRGLFEFKTYQGDRLLWFYYPSGGIVLTNGFKKGEPEQDHFAIAERYRDELLG